MLKFPEGFLWGAAASAPQTSSSYSSSCQVTLSRQGNTRFCTTDLRFCGFTVAGRTPTDVNAASRQKTAVGACVPLSTEGMLPKV